MLKNKYCNLLADLSIGYSLEDRSVKELLHLLHILHYVSYNPTSDKETLKILARYA
jgi:hypothetical protein